MTFLPTMSGIMAGGVLPGGQAQDWMRGGVSPAPPWAQIPGLDWNAPGKDSTGMPLIQPDPAFNAFYEQQQAAGLDFPAIMEAWQAQHPQPGHVVGQWPGQAPGGWYGGQGVAGGAAPMQPQMTPLAALGGMYGPQGGLAGGMGGGMGAPPLGMAGGGGWNALLAGRARSRAVGAMQPLSAFAGAGRGLFGGLFGR